ncbi:MAG: hypothetical protein V4653_10550 [Pseudomonadota bacterium]
MVEMLMTAETPGGPKTPRGTINTLLMAVAVMLLDHPDCIPGRRIRGGGPGVPRAIARFEEHIRAERRRQV